MRNNQAFSNAEKAEIENLFLDCIEQCKREQYKKDNQSCGMPGGRFRSGS